MDFDKSNENFNNLFSEIRNKKITSETLSETDTRVKIIDTILKAVLFWPENNINREEKTDDIEKVKFTDYRLKINNKNYLVVEAKKSGINILLPKKHKRRIKIGNLIKDSSDLSYAIKQCKEYCDDCGLRYGIVTNGLSWILFRAIRDDIPWKDGLAIVFNDLDDINNNFIEFINYLSFENINKNQLDKEFSKSPYKTRKMIRILDLLHSADKPLERNRLHAHLYNIIEAYFKDIADNEYIDLLKDCYIYSDDHSFIDFSKRIKDEIPQFLKTANVSNVVTTESKSGTFSDIMHETVESYRGKLLLILGGIGAGKTTFLKRFFRLTDADFLNQKAVWFYIGFLGPPSDSSKIDIFIYQKILDTIREVYSDIFKEDRKTIKRAYKKELERLDTAIFQAEKLSASEIEERLTSYICEWQSDICEYAKHLLKLFPTRNKAVIICLDNVDQLPPLFQEQVYLAAQNIYRETNSIVILALREETYYSARTQKTFTAYSNQKYHVVSPDFMKLIGKRISFAIKDIEANNNLFPETHEIDKQTKYDILDFLAIIEKSLFQKNRNLLKFINSMCFGNMRLALEYFATFLLSGATYVEKMLGIYRSQGEYTIAFHEFIKSIMVDDRYYYSDSKSKILNVFNCSSEKNSSHFTTIRVLNYLQARESIASNEGSGYVNIDTILNFFEEIFDNRGDVVWTCNNMLNRSLIETNTKTTEVIDNSSHIRITSAGKYYYFLIRKFVYLDLVLIDTPIDDDNIRDKLFRISIDIEKIPDHEKYSKTIQRFDRTELFIEYLRKEENDEESKYHTMRSCDDFNENISTSILEEFHNDKAFILDTFKRNRPTEFIDEFIDE
jgi:hypothetical protein